MKSPFKQGNYRPINLLLLSGLILLAPACKGKEAAEHAQPAVLPVKEVRVVSVSAQPAQQQNEVAGTVTAAESATIAAKVAGVITALPVNLGSAVRQGQVLVKISAGEINAQLAQAETQLAQAKRNLEREQRLLAKEAATRESVKNLEEAVRLAEAGLAQAQTMVGYTTLTAPFSGLVSEKIANIGDLATPGTPLLVVENNNRLQVAVPVPEALLARIKSGDLLPLSIPAANFSGSGKVAEISPAGDPASRTAIIKLALTAPGLRAGQFARVTLPGDDASTAAAITVPAQAVVAFGQMEKIFVVENGTAHLRLVRTGERHDGQVEILAGLDGGAQVVSEGATQLSDGQPVRVQP
ncbi:MAG TPA: efflux RND transporter periplasmic adaptor subunit [Desulfurivibrionaceae bacterium]|nr:efflux RND transporter periplasmic adaptor subunit [Desulfurivibrionaceae bacterium]